MRPERAARLLATIGSLMLSLVLLLRGISLSIAFEENLTARTATPDGIPIQQNFTFSEDGQQIFFQQGLASTGRSDGDLENLDWYSMALEGGPVEPSGPPPEPDILPFLLDEQELFLTVGEGVSLTTGSPPGMLVNTYALSPDGSAMAFAAAFPGGPHQLYILYTSEQLDWLGEEETIDDLTWSLDGEHLVYIAPREGNRQILRIDRSGSNLQQLTFDDTEISSLVWLANGLGIAYIAVAQSDPPATDIYLVSEDGSNQMRLTEDTRQETNLSSARDGNEIAFTASLETVFEGVNYLFVIDPQSGQQRRVYPTYNIEMIRCPANIPRGSTRTVQFDLSNSSLFSAGVPIILRYGNQPLPVQDERQANALRIETVDVPEGDTRQVEWEVRSAGGLITYVSILIDLGEYFPMAEQNCTIPNTYLGLPNLPFLPSVLPLSITGMLLTIPWLRHQKKRWLWAIWWAFPIIVMLMIGIEATRVQSQDTLLTLFYEILNTI